MEIELLDNGKEGRKIEGVDSENELMDSENEGEDNDALLPERKGYILCNTPTINYNDGRDNRRSMG